MAAERMAVIRCEATASNDDVQRALFRAADLVGEAVRWGLSGKRTILIKANMGTDDLRIYLGRHVALSEGKITETHATMATVERRGGGNGYGVFLKQVTPPAREQGHLALYAPIANGPAWTTS